MAVQIEARTESFRFVHVSGLDTPHLYVQIDAEPAQVLGMETFRDGGSKEIRTDWGTVRMHRRISGIHHDTLDGELLIPDAWSTADAARLRPILHALHDSIAENAFKPLGEKLPRDPDGSVTWPHGPTANVGRILHETFREAIKCGWMVPATYADLWVIAWGSSAGSEDNVATLRNAAMEHGVELPRHPIDMELQAQAKAFARTLNAVAEAESGTVPGGTRSDGHGLWGLTGKPFNHGGSE